MSTFHLFPKLPKELRLKIYEDAFEPRILQLGVDYGVPFPPVMRPLGAEKGPPTKLLTRIPSLFSVCRESRDLCKSIFVAFGPTFIHPKLDTLYISMYAAARMIPTELPCNDDVPAAYRVAAFDKVAIEYSVKNLPKDIAAWHQRPKTRQLRHGSRKLRVPGIWPATDYAEFFRCFGAPREVLIVPNGIIQWTGGFTLFKIPKSVELMATDLESSEQKNLVEFLKSQLQPSVAKQIMEFKVVDVVKQDSTWVRCPYSITSWIENSERYPYV